MNKAYKYTLTANEHKEITFDVGVNRLAISNANGTDGDITIVTSEITKTDSGEICSFVDGADAPFADFKVNIKAVQSGSGDPSPTNVRPISGFSAVGINITGVNVWDEEWEVGGINHTTGQNTESAGVIRSKNYIGVKGNTNYNFLKKTNGIDFHVHWYDADKNFISYEEVYAGNINYKVTTSPQNAVYMRFNLTATYGATYNNDVSINYPSTDTTYHAYNDETINIDCQSVAGTVYGGTLDVKTGVLTVTHANIASYDGETINEPWISSMDKYAAGATPTTGAQVVYPLTTPVTYQLTPTEIRSLLGVNNVWADCGPVDVRYFVQSTQPMIDYIDAQVSSSDHIIEATQTGSTYTLDNMTCDELLQYANLHPDTKLKVARTGGFDIFTLNTFIGSSVSFVNTLMTTAVGSQTPILYVRELQANANDTGDTLTSREMNIS